jgi:hypothetical protein
MKKISLSRLSDFAQIVSAIAVVISLIYVGHQIRANTEATRAATRQSITETDFEYISSIFDPLTLLEAEAKVQAGSELTPLENFALIERQHLNFRIFENAYYQYSRGLLEPETWERYRRILRRIFSDREHVRVMWEQKKSIFEDSFREEVEAIRTGLGSANK